MVQLLGQFGVDVECGRKDVMHPYRPVLYQGLCSKGSMSSDAEHPWGICSSKNSLKGVQSKATKWKKP